MPTRLAVCAVLMLALMTAGCRGVEPAPGPPHLAVQREPSVGDVVWRTLLESTASRLACGEWGVAILEDGGPVHVVGSDGTERWMLEVPGARIRDVFVSKSAPSVLASYESTRPGTPQRGIVCARDGDVIWERRSDDPTIGFVGRWSTDGARVMIVQLPLAKSSPTGLVVEVADATTGDTLWSWKAAKADLAAFAASPDLSRVAVSVAEPSIDGTTANAFVVGLESGREVFRTTTAGLAQLAFFDSLSYVCAESDGRLSLRTWPAKGSSETVWSRVLEPLSAVSTSGRSILAQSFSSLQGSDKSVRLSRVWVLDESGAIRHTSKSEGAFFAETHISDAGRTLVTMPSDGAADAVVAHPGTEETASLGGPWACLAFTPDQDLVLGSAVDGGVRALRKGTF